MGSSSTTRIVDIAWILAVHDRRLPVNSEIRKVAAGATEAAPAARGSGAGEVDHRADEALDHPDVFCGAGRERCVDLLIAVEIAAAVRVERSDGSRVVNEVEAVDAPATTVVARVAGGGRGDVQLQPEELVDGVEAVVGSACVRQVGWRADSPIELTVHVERRTTGDTACAAAVGAAGEDEDQCCDDRRDAESLHPFLRSFEWPGQPCNGGLRDSYGAITDF